MEKPADDKMLIFLCSGAAKAKEKKLSYRIAIRLEAMGIATIGDLQNMSEQHSSSQEMQKRMLFINDCRSGCVNVFTHGFHKNNYIFLDVSPFLTATDFDIEQFIHSTVLPEINSKWLAGVSHE